MLKQYVKVITYRELKRDLVNLFSNVDNSTMDNQVTFEDIEAIECMVKSLKDKWYSENIPF